MGETGYLTSSLYVPGSHKVPFYVARTCETTSIEEHISNPKTVPHAIGGVSRSDGLVGFLPGL